MGHLAAFLSGYRTFLLSTLFMVGAGPPGAQPPADAPAAGGFVPPRPIKMIDAVYPVGGAAQLQESIVELTMTIDVKGRPHDVKVTRSTGSKAFDSAAVQALERWAFAPATQDGQPVEAPYQMQYSFLANTRDLGQHSGGARLTGVKRGASRDFTTAYSALQKALQAGDRPAADAALKHMQVTTQYEEATYGLASYQ